MSVISIDKDFTLSRIFLLSDFSSRLLADLISIYFDYWWSPIVLIYYAFIRRNWFAYKLSWIFDILSNEQCETKLDVNSNSKFSQRFFNELINKFRF